MDMALKNSLEALENLKQKTLREEERTIGASEELTQYLDLPMYRPGSGLRYIQYSRANSVASMVVFEKGNPTSRNTEGLG